LDVFAQELGLPEGVVPIVGLTVGVPIDVPPSPLSPRLPPELVFHVDQYREPTSSDLDSAYAAMGDEWYNSLSRFFGSGGVLGQREKIWMRTLEQQGFKDAEGKTADD
jgi:hypothetical protein